MSTLFTKFMTAFMSLLFALNIVSTTDYQKPRPAHNNSTVVVEHRTDAQENTNYEVEKDNTVTKEEQGKDETPAEDANIETGTDSSNSQGEVADNTAKDNNNAAPVEDGEYSDYEVLETIDISATEEDDVTLTLYAAPDQEEAAVISTEDNSSEDEIETYSAEYVAPRMARAYAMSRTAAYSIDSNEDEVTTFAADETNSGISFREENNARTSEKYVVAVVNGSGEMEENVYRHFVDVDKFIEETRTLLAAEYGLETAENVTYTLPDNIDKTDLFEVDMNINYYAGKDCAAGPKGTLLSITDNVRAAINPADLLKYSPDSVEFQGDITTISSGAFLFCEELTEITIPATVKRIGENAFSYCSNLNKVVLNEGLEVIEPGAFMYCSNLEEIVIPSTVTEIGDEAFVFLKNPSRIVCPSEEIFNLVNDASRVTFENTEIVNTAENA